MCGICGINKNNSERISGMLEAMRYRGPDEEGVYADESVSLGIRRLSIIDLKTGSQPMYNENRSIAVVCNGEIYNFKSLREDLSGKGHSFYTNSDTEVLAHLYEEYGKDCLRHIKGMFAFALWDKDKEELFIARDRFGIKPLYYYNKNGLFAFASEAKALLSLPFVSRAMNFEALDLYLSLEYVPSPYSIWQVIHKLKPAHYMVYKNNVLEIRKYWNLGNRSQGERLSYPDARDRLEAMLDNSVSEHLVSDVPLGIFLSGGIDSSALTALAVRHLGQKISTFSMGFKERSFDESKYALYASRCFGTRHYNYMFGINDFTDSFNDVASRLDEPFADMSIFPTYMLSRLSREHIKVTLSGEGGDELFMGYPTHRAHRYINLLNNLPVKIRGFFRHAVNALPVSSDYFSLDFKLKQLAKGMGEPDPVLRHMSWMAAFSDTEKRDLLYGNFSRERTVSACDFFKAIAEEPGAETIHKTIQFLDIFTYLSEGLLVKSDRASMFSSLEVRVPYLDHELAEFTWGLDSGMIYRKRLLKDAVKGLVPANILSRAKKGFPIPFSAWIRDKRFFDTIKEFFDRSFIEKQGLFVYGYVKSILNDHLSGKRDNRKKLRVYLMFQAWFKYWGG